MYYQFTGFDWSNIIHLLDDSICALVSDRQGSWRHCYLGCHLAGIGSTVVRIDLCCDRGDCSVDGVLCVDGDVGGVDSRDGGDFGRLSATMGPASSVVDCNDLVERDPEIADWPDKMVGASNEYPLN